MTFGKMATKRKSVLGRVWSIVKNITVEPTGFLLLFANAFSALASETLNLDKTCRVNLQLPEDVCDAVRNQDSLNNTENEQMVQQYLAAQLVWKSALQTALPCLLYPFVGGWLDLTGRRKLFMIIPLFGELLQNLSNVLNVVFFFQTPVEAVMFFDVFFSITGGTSVVFLAIYSYIADVTTDRNRTFRMGIVGFFIQIGQPAGSALSGIILRDFGYYAIYGASIVIHMLNLFYLIFFLADNPRSPEQKQYDNRGIFHGLKTFFDPIHVKNTFIVFFKKTEDKRFRRLLAILFAFCLLMGPIVGEKSILFLSTRYRFNWDEVQFSIFQTYVFVINIAGSFITVLIFARLLRLHDSILGLIACTSKIAGAFVFCFAATGAIFYIAPALEIFSNSGFLALRSTVSKIVESEELAKVNSVLGLFENLMPFAFVSMYTTMYAATMEVLPGAPFLLGAGFALPAGMVFLWLFVRHRKSLGKLRFEENLNKQDLS